MIAGAGEETANQKMARKSDNACNLAKVIVELRNSAAAITLCAVIRGIVMGEFPYGV